MKIRKVFFCLQQKEKYIIRLMKKRVFERREGGFYEEKKGKKKKCWLRQKQMKGVVTWPIFLIGPPFLARLPPERNLFTPYKRGGKNAG